MKHIFFLLVCCLVFAAAKAAVAVLVVAILLVLSWGAIFRPVQTHGFIASCIIVSLFNRYPGWSIAIVGIIILTTTFRASSQETIITNDGA